MHFREIVMTKAVLKKHPTTKIALICSVLFLHLPISQAGEEVGKKIVAAIKAQNELYMNAFSRGDAKAVAKLHSENGSVLPPKRPRVHGRAAIESMLTHDFSQGMAVLTLTTTDIQKAGELVYETGEHQVRTGQGEGSDLLEQGNYLVIWKRSAAGVWQMHVDIWNLN